MKPLCILHVTNNYTPYAGGLVSSLNAHIASLQSIGHHVHVVTFAFLKDHTDDPSWVIRLPVLYRFAYKKNLLVVPFRMKRALMNICATIQPDIIHIHHPFLLGAAALQVAHQLSIATCFTYHTRYEQYLHYVPLPRWLTRPLVSWYVTRFCQRVDMIVAPSLAMIPYIKSQSITTPISVIASPLQQPFIHQSYSKTIRNVHDQFRLLVVARFVPEKNIHFALDTFCYLAHDRRFQLTLIGFGCLYEQLQQYAYQEKQLPRDRVQFIYKPDQRIIAQYYHQSDLFLFTSHTDTQGLVVAESLVAGTPVITVSGLGQSDIIINTKNGLYAHCPQQMAYYCTYLADNPIIHYQMGYHAFLSARYYLPKEIEKKLQDLYQYLIV